MQDAYLVESSFVEEKKEEDKINYNVLVSRFLGYGKQLFRDNLENEVAFPQFLKSVSELFAFDIPQELKQIFIPLRYAPRIWANELPIIYQFNELLKNYKKSNFDIYDQYDEVKRYFIKWATEPIDKEKAYYALSSLNLIDRNINRDNFIKYILAGTIFTFDSKFRLIDKADDMFKKAESTVLDLQTEASIKPEFLYYINVYRGFNELKENNFLKAEQHFNAALTSKANGITALFYSSICKKHLEDIPLALDGISSLIKYDIKRLQYANSVNNLNLFGFLLRNCVTYEIFLETEFSDIYSDIKSIIDSFCTQESSAKENIIERLSILKELKVEEFYDEEIRKEIEYLDNFFTTYKSNSNVMIQIVLENLLGKFNNIIEKIKTKIKEHINAKVAVELEQFNMGIEEDTELIAQLHEELRHVKETTSKTLNSSIQLITKNSDAVIKNYEDKLEHIEATKEFDAAGSFNNNMVYNLIISMIVFLAGGFIGSVGNSSDVSLKSSEFITSLMANGIKWGGIIFFLGMIISFISYVSTVIERSNQKQRLAKKITSLKAQKEVEIENAKKEAQRKQKSLEDSLQNKIAETQKRIENLKIEKSKQETISREKFEKELETQILKLNSI